MCNSIIFCVNCFWMSQTEILLSFTFNYWGQAILYLHFVKRWLFQLCFNNAARYFQYNRPIIEREKDLQLWLHLKRFSCYDWTKIAFLLLVWNGIPNINSLYDNLDFRNKLLTLVFWKSQFSGFWGGNFVNYQLRLSYWN